MEKLVRNLTLHLAGWNSQTFQIILVVLAIALFVLGSGAPGTPGDIGTQMVVIKP